MSTPLSERQDILADLNRLATGDLASVWRAGTTADLDSAAFQSLIADAYPEITTQYASAAADLGAEWYEESAPNLPYRAVPLGLPPAEQLAKSSAWALLAPGNAGLDRLAGASSRTVLNANRLTIVGNSEREHGSTWARVAKRGACAFCRLLATRENVYTSRGAALLSTARKSKRDHGDGYHDHCHCVAVEVRPGKSFTPPAYVEQWQADYEAAASRSRGTKAILADMRATELGRTNQAKRIAALPKMNQAQLAKRVEELEPKLVAAMEAERFDEFDAIAAEMQQAEDYLAKATAKAEAAKARREAKSAATAAAKDAELDALVAGGEDFQEAYAKVYGVSVEKQNRQQAMQVLRNQGFSGDSFDELTRNGYRDYVYQSWLQAEDATNGYMIKRKYGNQGIDPMKLWASNEATARKYASPELLEWWDQHGRVTLAEFRAEFLDPSTARNMRNMRSDFLQ